MGKAHANNSSTSQKKTRTALTPESRTNQMISLAFDQAEKELRAGTASSQVVTHFLKLATEEKQLEREKLKEENKLLKAKTEAIQSAQRIEELYANAIAAMRNYSGQGDPDED